MTKKDAEYLYGSVEAYYWIAAAGSVLIGVICFLLQIYINGTDDILEKAAYCCFYAVVIFLLATFEVTLDCIKNKEKEK